MEQVSFYNQGQEHIFWIDGAGMLCHVWGSPIGAFEILDGDYEPWGKVTAEKVWPDPSNPFGTYFAIHGPHVGNGGIREMRWWGSNWKPADHWEGPFAVFHR